MSDSLELFGCQIKAFVIEYICREFSLLDSFLANIFYQREQLMAYFLVYQHALEEYGNARLAQQPLPQRTP